MSGFDVPGSALFALPMVVPRSSEYARLGVPPEATSGEIRAATARYVARLRAGGASDDDIAAVNVASIEDSAARAEHDARHPPLSLLRLEPTWEPVLDDRGTGLSALRREIESFLAEAGDAVHHPMDTTRTDFTGDFTYTSLLDGSAGRPNPLRNLHGQ
jgi:hypothetical protein